MCLSALVQPLHRPRLAPLNHLSEVFGIPHLRSALYIVRGIVIDAIILEIYHALYLATIDRLPGKELVVSVTAVLETALI